MSTGRQRHPDRFTYISDDGLAIVCSKWSSRGPVRGIVQIAHGLGEHVGRYSELAQRLAREGFEVYGNDHRGHGLTARASGRQGDFGAAGFDQLVEDMVALRVIAKHEHPHVPYILLGHSMGSFAAQQFILDHSRSIAALVLSGSGSLDSLAREARDAGAAGHGMNLLNATFEPARTPFDWLSRDTAEVDAFIADPLCFPALMESSMRSFLAASPRLADARELRNVRADLPIYVFSGSDDPVGERLTGVRTLIERYRGAGLTGIAHHFYPGGRHEMLHELNRDEVVANLLVWLTAVVTPRPSVAVGA
jgi:alpha-beta hydrolase superfamily lysophospholipase